jgi:hypothetical protein
LLRGDIEFLEEYESSINELFDELNTMGHVKEGFSKDQHKRLNKLAATANAPLKLVDSFHEIYFLADEDKIKAEEEQLNKTGLKINRDHYFTVICHSYQVISEMLKIRLVALIDFDAIGYTNADMKPLGSLIRHLKDKFPNNKFINYLKTDIRNSITHYTYYYDNNQLHLCKGVFDSSPKKVKLEEIIVESRKLDILDHSLFLIYLDKYHSGSMILLEG